MQFDLSGKVAVVTGGYGVLGQAMCRALAQAGASVVVIGRDAAKANTFAQTLPTSSLALAADVQDTDALYAAAEQTLAKYGRVDILVNGAGGNRADATAMPQERTFFELPPDALRAVFDLNLMGTILPSQVFGAHMARAGGGAIVNISSMAAQRALTRVIAYGAAKAAVDNFTRWLAVDMATQHSPQIRVNAIAPGFFLGEQNRYLLQTPEGALTARGQQIIDHTPMRRFGNPDDLGGALVWLASDAARFVTGIVVPIDGGFSAYSGV